jgi:predicted ATPase
MLPTPYAIRIELKRDEVPSFDDYPFSLPAVRHLHELTLHPKVADESASGGDETKPEPS